MKNSTNFPPRVFVTQNVYTNPPAPEAHYEQAEDKYLPRDPYISIDEHTAIAGALLEWVWRLRDAAEYVLSSEKAKRLNHCGQFFVCEKCSRSQEFQSMEYEGESLCGFCRLGEALAHGAVEV